jgi:signal transduction histidine kinase/CheY-like chemotaxis protein
VIAELLRAKVKVFAELYRKTRQLETLNMELEQRVAERTAELARTNAELEERVEQRTREREAALAQVHEMQKLESLGQLTGGVAHDFNNLLTAVLGNLELVKKHLPSDSQLLRHVDGAIQGAERGATLTKHMLAFARRQELKPETVELAKLIDSMTEMLRCSLGPTVQIKTEFSAYLPRIRADPNQLELALLNLAVNARDAMPDGGSLTIAGYCEEAAAGDAPALTPGDYVCVRVRDTGCGMDEAALKRATEPFFTTKHRGRGTGLGLSMVDGFVAQSGGAMRISSQPNVGTAVELWLPVWDADETHSPTPTAPPAHDGATPAFRVLVVDDDPIVRAGTMAMLEDLGHSAIGAGSGAGALEVLRSEPRIDIVITDYAMPEMTGVELAAETRLIRPDLPIVITTGYSDTPNEEPSLPRLAKPYRQRELAVLIETLVDRRLTYASSGGVAGAQAGTS